jgi:hypothetical protein
MPQFAGGNVGGHRDLQERFSAFERLAFELHAVAEAFDG